MAVSGDTPVTFSMTQVLSVSGMFAAAVLGFAYFVTARSDANYAALQGDVTEVREWTRDDSKSRSDGEAALAKGLADLTAQLQVTTAELTNVTSSLTSLDASIQAVDTKLTGSIKRQEAFEQFVVTRLPTGAGVATMVPTDWVKGQDAIKSTLFSTGGDPLQKWFDGFQK